MTTSVKVEAHCDGETKEVLIQISGKDDIVLQDGESYDDVVYDDVTLSVKEREK